MESDIATGFRRMKRLLASVPKAWWKVLGPWLVLAGVAAIVLWHLRTDAVDGEARVLGVLSLALTDDIDRGLRGSEEGLKAVKAELSDGALRTDQPSSERALRTRAELMPLIDLLWVVGEDGRVLAASRPVPAPALSAFWPAPDPASDAVVVSAPFDDVSGTRGDRTLIALCMRLQPGREDGARWLIAALPTAELLGALGTVAPAGQSGVAVWRGDGVRLAGANLIASGLAGPRHAMPLLDVDRPRLRRTADGLSQLTNVHDVSRYGLRVEMARNIDPVLSDWLQTAVGAGIGLLLLALIMARSAQHAALAARRKTEGESAVQAQVARASRLESLGTLAGSVAHDFNNILAAIVGYGEMARDEAPEGSDQARHLDKVLTAALRGQGVVERILRFSRSGARRSTVFEVEPIVQEVLQLMSASLEPGIVLERVLEAPGARLRGDPTQFVEAVLNLCRNGVQSMPRGGLLTVSVRRMQSAAPRVLSHSQVRTGRYVVVGVADEGVGITPDVAERLFEPFFTTRGADSGTGLGLAVVHGVVTEFGGGVDVQSAIERGSRFTLYFPETSEPANRAAPAAEVLVSGDGQRILVVDDEPDLVAMAHEMLSGLGYDPETTTDPQLALERLRAKPDAYAAMITDEVMPGMTGTRLTEAVRRIVPDLPVLLVSGYGGASLAERASAAGVTLVLAKPLMRADLSRALSEVLRSTA